jgi:trigger factor
VYLVAAAAEREHPSIMAEETKDNQPESEDTEVDPKQTDDLPGNKVDVEEVGTLRKKVTVTIPRERIDAKLDEMFGELSGTAQVPGFRIGRAPRRLIEKRFGKDISEDVRNALVGESMGDAIEQSELKILGEPEMDLESVELPETGDLAFSFEAEVFPEFKMPDLKGIKVEKPIIEITDEQVERQIGEWAESQATFEQTDSAAQSDDMVTAGAKVHVEGQDEPVDSPGLSLRVAPGQIEGMPLLELGKELTGKKSGDTASLEVNIPEAHPNEQWRGKKARIEISISACERRFRPSRRFRFPHRTPRAAPQQGAGAAGNGNDQEHAAPGRAVPPGEHHVRSTRRVSAATY